MFIGKPNEICNQSYILFEVNNEKEAKSLLSYLKCKLPNFMLSLRKSSQDISETTCKWIPLVPLNKELTDNEIYKYFKLTDDEIKLVKNTKVIGYSDKNELDDLDDLEEEIIIKSKHSKPNIEIKKSKSHKI